MKRRDHLIETRKEKEKRKKEKEREKEREINRAKRTRYIFIRGRNSFLIPFE